MMKWVTVGVLAMTLLGLAGCDDDDEDIEALIAVVDLTPLEEVPLCELAGAAATGDVVVTITDDNEVLVDDLTWSGLSGPATAAHIHFGAPGVAGPILLDFGTDLTTPLDRSFTEDDYPSPPPTGAPATFDAFVAEMRAGRSYVNVHTAACPAGEIRGQIP